MPENEFELYLSLLSRFLRLKPAQHGEIADELRDHLEARLEELTSQGLSRDAAIRQALDEFGDAAELANHFTHLAHIRKRRLIMRVTFGTVAALAASLLVATAFWPETPQAPLLPRAMAQFAGGAPGPVAAQPGAAVLAADDEGKLAIEAKLNQRLGIGTIRFEQQPVSDVLSFLSDKIKVDILCDKAVLEEGQIALDTPVSLTVEHANLTARGALELVLEPLGLNYTIRDGLVMVTTAEHANQILVYNVRDLVQSQSDHGGAAGGMGLGPQPMMPGGAPAGMAGTPGAAVPNGRVAGQPRSGMMGLMLGGVAPQMEGGMGGGFGGGPIVIRETDSLAQLIAVTIDPSSWDSSGGNGSIVQYRELLVVKNSQSVHGKIKVLLDMLRTSSAGGVPAPGARRG